MDEDEELRRAIELSMREFQMAGGQVEGGGRGGGSPHMATMAGGGGDPDLAYAMRLQQEELERQQRGRGGGGGGGGGRGGRAHDPRMTQLFQSRDQGLDKMTFEETPKEVFNTEDLPIPQHARDHVAAFLLENEISLRRMAQLAESDYCGRSRIRFMSGGDEREKAHVRQSYLEGTWLHEGFSLLESFELLWRGAREACMRPLGQEVKGRLVMRAILCMVRAMDARLPRVCADAVRHLYDAALHLRSACITEATYNVAVRCIPTLVEALPQLEASRRTTKNSTYANLVTINVTESSPLCQAVSTLASLGPPGLHVLDALGFKEMLKPGFFEWSRMTSNVEILAGFGNAIAQTPLADPLPDLGVCLQRCPVPSSFAPSIPPPGQVASSGIDVYAPDAREEGRDYYVGSRVAIKWRSWGRASLRKISIKLMQGDWDREVLDVQGRRVPRYLRFITIISGKTENTGEFVWTIPRHVPPGEHYKVLVLTNDEAGSESDQSLPFDILPGEPPAGVPTGDVEESEEPLRDVSDYYGNTGTYLNYVKARLAKVTRATSKSADPSVPFLPVPVSAGSTPPVYRATVELRAGVALPPNLAGKNPTSGMRGRLRLSTRFTPEACVEWEELPSASPAASSEPEGVSQVAQTGAFASFFNRPNSSDGSGSGSGAAASSSSASASGGVFEYYVEWADLDFKEFVRLGADGSESGSRAAAPASSATSVATGGPVAPAVEVTAPKFGDIAYVGQPINIEWEASAAFRVNIRLFVKADEQRIRFESMIKENHPSSAGRNVFQWHVPRSAPIGENFKVVVECAADRSVDDQSLFFSIAPEQKKPQMVQGTGGTARKNEPTGTDAAPPLMSAAPKHVANAASFAQPPPPVPVFAPAPPAAAAPATSPAAVAAAAAPTNPVLAATTTDADGMRELARLFSGMRITQPTIDALVKNGYLSAVSLCMATNEDLKSMGIVMGQVMEIKAVFRQENISNFTQPTPSMSAPPLGAVPLPSAGMGGMGGMAGMAGVPPGGVPAGGVGMGPMGGMGGMGGMGTMPGVSAMGAGAFYQTFPPAASYPGAAPGMAATGYPAPSVPTFGAGAAPPMMPSVPPMYPAGGGAAGMGAPAHGAPHPGMGVPPQGAPHPGMAGSGMGTASPMGSVSQSRGTPSFAISNFKALYQAASVADQHYKLFDMVHHLITAYCTTHGIDPRFGDNFFRQLSQEAFSASTTELLTKVELAAQRMWTSALRMEGAGVEHEKELCAIINHSIRNDANLDMLRPAALLVRNINQLCVTRRKGTPVCPPEFVCYRGSSLPDEFRSFFSVGLKYRVPGFLATSTSEGVAFEFLYRAHQDTQRPVVLWRVHLDKRGKDDFRFRCKHVNFVTNTHVKGEDEFLFAPYSVFTVQNVEWKQGDDRVPHIIDIVAAIDNRDEPEDLPTAPWY